MGTKYDLIKDSRIQHKGVIFDFGAFYKHAYDWLSWRRYDVTETKYKEIIKESGKEYLIQWEATRDIDEYSRLEIDVKWELFAVNDVKVSQDGKEIKMQKAGELNVYVTAILVLDYQGSWETNWLLKFLKSFFEKYLYAGTITRLKGRIWDEGWEFYNELKAYLNLYQF